MDDFNIANNTIATTVEADGQVYVRLDLPDPVWYLFMRHRLIKVCDERTQTLERHYECAQ
jgi:hypothetical protein